MLQLPWAVASFDNISRPPPKIIHFSSTLKKETLLCIRKPQYFRKRVQISCNNWSCWLLGLWYCNDISRNCLNISRRCLFSTVSQWNLECERGSRCYQQGEDPSRGLLQILLELSRNSFPALLGSAAMIKWPSLSSSASHAAAGAAQSSRNFSMKPL